MKKDSKVLFEEIMDSLFSDVEKEKTLAEYKKNHYKGISEEWGIYVVKNSKNKEIKLLDSPEIVTKKSIYWEDNFGKKVNAVNNLYLYIGKTNCKKGIKDRLSKYIRFGYGTTKIHEGGYLLWFVKNNKDLYANFATLAEIEKKQPDLYEKAKEIFETSVTNEEKTSNQPVTLAEIIEIGLISLHNIAYYYPPLANANKKSLYIKMNTDTFSYRIYIEWKKYWENVLN